MKFRDDHSWKLFFKRTIAAQIHLFAFFAALAGFVVFVLSPSIRGIDFIACALFALVGAGLMGISAFFHFVNDGLSITPELEKKLEDLDHIAIYLFIAATYTPFLINAVNSSWKLPLLVIIWFLALAGAIYTKVKHHLPAWTRARWFSTSLFLLMGWTLIVRIGEIHSNLSAWRLTLLALGGLSYSFGALIYILRRPNFFPGVFGFHELWHLAVLIGFSFHYALVLSFYGT